MKLKNVNEKIDIEVPVETMWTILSQYGDVSNFHAGVVSSENVKGSDNIASIGCERICNIVDMGLKITLKERIIDYVEGESYQYEVYEWKNFPLRKMLFAFNITSNNVGGTILRIDVDYKAKPAFLTPLMAGKMKHLIQDVLLGYKYYAEFGLLRVPIKEIKKHYSQQNFKDTQAA